MLISFIMETKWSCLPLRVCIQTRGRPVCFVRLSVLQQIVRELRDQITMITIMLLAYPRARVCSQTEFELSAQDHADEPPSSL
jgi:hypothetical protein